jgi:hypothetical protein
VLLVTAVAATALGGEDDRHPREPDKPLSVQLNPWLCSTCSGPGSVKDDAHEIDLFGLAPAEIAKRVGAGRKWYFIESPNFQIFSTLKAVRVKHSDSAFTTADLNRLRTVCPELKLGSGGTYIDAHQRAHLYHVRLERLYAHFAALTSNERRWLGMKDRFEVYLFEGADEYAAFWANVLVRASKPKRVAHRHVEGRKNYLVFATTAERHKGGDCQLHCTVFHMVAHNLVNGYNNYYTDTWAWLEEGFGHFYGRRESTRHNHFCLFSGEPPSSLERGNWRKKIYVVAKKKRAPPFHSWCERLDPRQISDMEHAICWSYVEWLARTEPLRLATLVELASDHKKKRTAVEAIQDVFGVAPEQLHEQWREYVLREYKK